MLNVCLTVRFNTSLLLWYDGDTLHDGYQGDDGYKTISVYDRQKTVRLNVDHITRCFYEPEFIWTFQWVECLIVDCLHPIIPGYSGHCSPGESIQTEKTQSQPEFSLIGTKPTPAQSWIRERFRVPDQSPFGVSDGRFVLEYRGNKLRFTQMCPVEIKTE